jgi:DNA-binding transcriptional regulator GbsR (MarR family)
LPVQKPKLRKDKLPPELDSLADGIGRFIEYWGFKAIHGRIWTLLYLSKVPLSSIEISRKLNVSKTLLSFSISELLDYDVIQEAGKGIKRTVYFRANPNITAVILNVLRKRERPLMGEIYSSFEQVHQHSQQIDSEFKLDLERMRKMREFILSAQEALQSLIRHTDPNSDLMSQFLLIAAVLAGGQKFVTD